MALPSEVNTHRASSPSSVGTISGLALKYIGKNPASGSPSGRGMLLSTAIATQDLALKTALLIVRGRDTLESRIPRPGWLMLLGSLSFSPSPSKDPCQLVLLFIAQLQALIQLVEKARG